MVKGEQKVSASYGNQTIVALELRLHFITKPQMRIDVYTSSNLAKVTSSSWSRRGPIFCVLDFNLRIAKVEYRGQTRYTNNLYRKILIDTYYYVWLV